MAGLDFAIVDQEHAPISIAQMDILALAGRAVGLPLLSRRWGNATDWIAPLLDLGLDGVMVPHVMDAVHAAAVCDAVRFSRGKRGLSPSPRAGNYGGYGIAEYRAHCDAQSVVMAQIEDHAALDRLDEIAQEPEVDVLFVGPADLSQSMGVSFPSAELDAAIKRVIYAGKKRVWLSGCLSAMPPTSRAGTSLASPSLCADQIRRCCANQPRKCWQ